MRERLSVRAALVDGVRQFFRDREVLEVNTPVLSQATSTDPAIEPFATRYSGPAYPDGLTLYLQTSPEFAMKRLLAQGSGPIYQLCPVFRNGEFGSRHNPEFTLLEWYRPGFDHHRLMAEVAELVMACIGRELAMEKTSYVDLFQQNFGWDPLEVGLPILVETAVLHGIDVDRNTLRSVDQWLDLLMSLVVEPRLGREKLTFVYDYPASQASLARLHPQDQRLACRFELYYQGVELANGFHELADAAEQQSRFEQENDQRKRAGQPVLPIDYRLIEALETGLPDCAGVALGLDRLLMLKLGAESLDQVLSFPLPQA